MAFAKPLNLLIAISYFSILSSVSYAETDTFKPGQQLRDWEQLVSAEGIFRLGFFTPSQTTLESLGSAGPRYLGIWFDQIPFYSLWVANRETPVPDSSGTLIIDADGKLKITRQGGPPIIISNLNQAAKASSSSSNFTATLLDSGNFVIRQMDSNGVAGPVLWQSFDYPHNMLLPGMKLGRNIKTGQSWTLTSWLSEKVPAPGAFKLGLDPTGANQLLIWRRGEVYWSSGLWKTKDFQLKPVFKEDNDTYELTFVTTENERYFTYSLKNKSKDLLSRIELETLGQITLFTLDTRNHQDRWTFETSGPCKYDNKNYSAVCLTEKPNECRNGSEIFVPKRGYMAQSQYWYSDLNLSLALSDCHAQCWKNCTCVAYQSVTDDGVGCQFWSKGSEFYPDESIERLIYLLTREGNIK